MNSIKKIQIKIDDENTDYEGYIRDNEKIFIDISLLEKLSGIEKELKNDILNINTDLDWIDVPINEIIILDAGHGGKDAGAVDDIDSTKNDHIRTLEKDLNLKIVKLTEKKLKELGVKVILTRTDDKFLELSERTNLANKTNAKLFLAVHFNAGDERAKGIETFKYKNTNNPLTNKFAKNLQVELVKSTNFKDRGVKKAGFYVLKNTKMSAALVELGFITNDEEEKLLHTQEFQDNVSNALVNAIVLTLNNI